MPFTSSPIRRCPSTSPSSASFFRDSKHGSASIAFREPACSKASTNSDICCGTNLRSSPSKNRARPSVTKTRRHPYYKVDFLEPPRADYLLLKEMDMFQKRRQTAVALLLTFVLTCAATAQNAPTQNAPTSPTASQTAPSATSSQPFRVDENTLFVYATVKGNGKEPLHGLKRSQFQIFEDDVEQQIGYFSEGGLWNVGLIL